MPRTGDGIRAQVGAPDTTTTRESVIYAELDGPIDSEELEILEAELKRVLFDVEAAVSDWQAMRMRMESAIIRLRYLNLKTVSAEDLSEICNFLTWVLNDQFAFLGVRRYKASTVDGQLVFERDPSGDLGTLKDSARRVLKNTYSANGELSPAVEDFLRSEEPVLIAKANSKSIVHRRTYQDYLGVKLYDDAGNLVGEDRFIGLFTADAYNRPASEIPLLRAKVAKIIKASPFVAGGHNEKALLHILETYPRDELFQVDVETLRDTCIEILRLYKRPRVKLIMRRDRFDRFLSAFVFIPRDVFNSDRRHAIGQVLAKSFDGRVSAFYPHFGDVALVRVHFIIGINPGAPQGPGITKLTHDIRAICRDWDDDLLATMRAGVRSVTPRILFDKYRVAFDAGYRDQTTTDQAIEDILAIEGLGGAPHRVRAYRKADDPDTMFRLSLYLRKGPARLSDLIPTLENFGLSIMTENAHHVVPAGDEDAEDGVWIHDFKTETQACTAIDFQRTKEIFEAAMDAILKGDCEDDGFNRLIITAGLNWREAWFLRAAAKHHLQTGFAYSQRYIEDALVNHPVITHALIRAFHAKFAPLEQGTQDAADAPDYDTEIDSILTMLDAVTSLDEDRILRRFVSLLGAMTRTNFYQTSANTDFRPCLAIKIDSAKLEEIPTPKPYREIFVSGPAIDGVHLRFGPIARGGLRWSDRKEDFRTEVLGLVKAQRVKNAVIVPNGAKGGFYPKKLPTGGDRAAIYEAGREAYKLFISSLLDVTDNIVDGKIIRPQNVISHDGDDPYLVVAADKGTAQFSDTANAISIDYGFWLGDAFASGGSVGYDHKAMGITARGAWEAVKRHFRERGKDIQREPFTVTGVGDMSGDVFGNGMLLSDQIKLIAAFDHRDIFMDPNPDPAISFAERQRLFALSRSSWQDYDKSLISEGGGVFSRQAKSIALSAQMKACLDCQADRLTPNELLTAILKAPAELFWLGGIGTYFKADQEENWRVGDRGNDAIRIDASEMRMNVVGEGANLGLTQRARIAFARKGGAINTDAIDNSAGVDSSDHEVNIKILLREAIQQGELVSDDREPLLADMTDDVAGLVLHHNYDQTRALTLAHTTGVADLDAHHRFIKFLETEGRLDRHVEDLPSNATLQGMIRERASLTRPELAVLLAYSKLWLFDELVASQVPEDPVFTQELTAYFPPAVQGFDKALANHRLRREIIA
ncbi:MAG: NAD-glutamate dehydrogenase domain-containing protein, partial [Pseudomonadota bacterium]